MKKYIIAWIMGLLAIIVCATSALAKEPFKTDPDDIVIKELDSSEVMTTLSFSFPIYWPSRTKEYFATVHGTPKWLSRYVWSTMFFEPMIFIDGDERRSFLNTSRGRKTYYMKLTYRTDMLTDNPTIQAALGYKSKHLSPEVRLCDNLVGAESSPLCADFFKNPFFSGSKSFKNTSPVVHNAFGKAFEVEGFLRRDIDPDDLEVWIQQDSSSTFERIDGVFTIEHEMHRGQPLHTVGRIFTHDAISYRGAVIDIRAVLGDNVYHHYIDLCRESDAAHADNFCAFTGNPFDSAVDIISFVEMDATYEIYARVNIAHDLYAEDLRATIKSDGDDAFVNHENYGFACDAGECVARISLAKDDFEGNVAIKLRYLSGGEHMSRHVDVCEHPAASASELCNPTFKASLPVGINANARKAITGEDPSEGNTPPPPPNNTQPQGNTPAQQNTATEEITSPESTPSLPGGLPSPYTSGGDADADDENTGCTLTPHARVGGVAPGLMIFIFLTLPIMVTRVTGLKRRR